MPGGILFGKEAAAPVHAKQVYAQPHHPVEITLDFKLRVQVVQLILGVACLPDPAPGHHAKIGMTIMCTRHSPIHTFSNSGSIESMPCE